MKISIITVTYNAEKLVERTVKSVLAQTFSSIEYIIIDGASVDGTLWIIEKYKPRIQKVISEMDKGIYDAMNKGLQVATGDYVLFLNAGDEFYSDTTLNDVFSSSSDADVYYGNTKVVDLYGNEIGDRRLKPPEKLNWKSFMFGMSVSHQSFIAKRSLCDVYDLRYSISADIDWVIKILKKSHKIENTKRYISKFLEGGTSSRTRPKALAERFSIMVKHYGWFVTICIHVYILFRYPFHKFTRKSMT